MISTLLIVGGFAVVIGALVYLKRIEAQAKALEGLGVYQVGKKYLKHTSSGQIVVIPKPGEGGGK